MSWYINLLTFSLNTELLVTPARNKCPIFTISKNQELIRVGYKRNKGGIFIWIVWAKIVVKILRKTFGLGILIRMEKWKYKTIWKQITVIKEHDAKLFKILHYMDAFYLFLPWLLLLDFQTLTLE
jgi:hypothetical protein